MIKNICNILKTKNTTLFFICIVGSLYLGKMSFCIFKIIAIPITTQDLPLKTNNQ